MPTNHDDWMDQIVIIAREIHWKQVLDMRHVKNGHLGRAPLADLRWHEPPYVRALRWPEAPRAASYTT
jgi:hypothetical protein